ncbi:methionyl aminopeptidase [Cladophialophora yegresii CBS 114405]|uniref:Methionyl aminopeptidase n=1 Tax=Cladophialophora yegresii CBS 114405 TaxID=1182544 RepID=W9W5Y9_9EURO|nr:methionyl aminopeptidase [Cladophialophora yegresii CBS 114405]EXJ53984.1 methionyl aminopeptidase [Cladophialophora yegresii CBS 114405]
MADTTADADTSILNADNLTKYKIAATISHKVLEEVAKWLADGEKIVDLCIKGDALLDEELSKGMLASATQQQQRRQPGSLRPPGLARARLRHNAVYKGKSVNKGIATPCTISPSSHVTPFTPLVSDAEEAATTIKAGELIKIQLGAQIDGFGAIVGNTVVVPKEKGAKADITGREADLLLATHYANELLLRLLVPPGLLATGTEEEKKKAAAEKPPTQTKISSLVDKIAKAYDVHVVQHTTSWLFEKNEIEGKKKIILSPADGAKGEGSAEVGEVWGVEVGMSLGSGKVKELDKRSTLLRRTTTTYGLKRPSSRQVLSEIVKKFGTFPFSLRQLDDERAGKVGVVECIRSGVLREYKPAAEADGSPVSRLFTTVGITKNGLVRLAAPPVLDLDAVKSDKKIEDEEILAILERPLAKSTGSKSKNKKKKKKPAKKAAAAAEEDDDDDEDDSDDE